MREAQPLPLQEVPHLRDHAVSIERVIVLIILVVLVVWLITKLL